ncbi:DMT family transporter [Alphaproteobacteria bacterium]|nr:DMT family transporter [Alphaproteobacteria bacterium]
MGVIFGLIGAIFIGFSDTIARVTSQKISLIILITYIMFISFILTSIWLLISWDWPRWEFYSWSVAIVSGVLNIIVVALLYKALSRGPVYVASPATSSFLVILILFNVLNGQPFTFFQLIAGIFVFIGILMLSLPDMKDFNLTKYSSNYLRVTAFLGIASGFTIALRFFLAQESLSSLTAFHSLYLNRVSALIVILFILLIYIIKNNKYNLPNGKYLILIIIQAVFENLALVSFLFGSKGDGRIGSTIGFSAFAIVTTATAWIWLGEKVPFKKVIWIVIISLSLLVSIVYGP